MMNSVRTIESDDISTVTLKLSASNPENTMGSNIFVYTVEISSQAIKTIEFEVN